MKRRPRIDAVLEQPARRTQIEECKRHFAVAAGYWQVDRRSHEAAASEAAAIINALVDAVIAEPGNGNLRRRPVYHYIANIAYAELTEFVSTPEQRAEVELPVHLPPGRPPNQHTSARQRVIDDLRRNPDLADSQVTDRAIKYGAWKPGESEAPADRARRIRRLRRDAAN